MNPRIFSAVCCAFLFLLGLTVAVWHSDQDLKRRLLQAETKLEQMTADHNNAMRAVNSAMIMREELHEQSKQRERDLEEILAKHKPFDCLIVPDDVRVRIDPTGDEDDKVSPPGNPAR